MKLFSFRNIDDTSPAHPAKSGLPRVSMSGDLVKIGSSDLTKISGDEMGGGFTGGVGQGLGIGLGLLAFGTLYSLWRSKSHRR